VSRLGAFKPRVARQALGLAESLAQALLRCKRRVDCLAAHFFNADALDEVVRALEEVGVLAVVLEEECRGLQSLFGGLDRYQPTAPIFTLAGVKRCSRRRSSSMPVLVESWTPKRQKSVPTQVFTMRTPLV